MKGLHVVIAEAQNGIIAVRSERELAEFSNLEGQPAFGRQRHGRVEACRVVANVFRPEATEQQR